MSIEDREREKGGPSQLPANASLRGGNATAQRARSKGRLPRRLRAAANHRSVPGGWPSACPYVGALPNQRPSSSPNSRPNCSEDHSKTEQPSDPRQEQDRLRRTPLWRTPGCPRSPPRSPPGVSSLGSYRSPDIEAKFKSYAPNSGDVPSRKFLRISTSSTLPSRHGLHHLCFAPPHDLHSCRGRRSYESCAAWHRSVPRGAQGDLVPLYHVSCNCQALET